MSTSSENTKEDSMDNKDDCVYPTQEMIEFWQFYKIFRVVVFGKKDDLPPAPPLFLLLSEDDQDFIRLFKKLNHNTRMSKRDFERFNSILASKPRIVMTIQTSPSIRDAWLYLVERMDIMRDEIASRWPQDRPRTVTSDFRYLSGLKARGGF